MLRKRKKQVILMAVFLLIAAFIVSRQSARRRPYNVILITLDALRADHLGCYGYQRRTSPAIDALAEEGVLFTQAVTVSTLTPVSLASFFTGAFPNTHGVYNFGYDLKAECLSLPGVLRRHGYRTAGTRGHAWLGDMLSGLEKDFDALIDGGINTQNPLEPYIRWLSQNKEQKFFLWVHFIDQPHTPYAPPPPFNGQFGSDAVSDRPEPLRVVDNRLGKGGIPRYLVQGGITDKNYYSAQYDGEIAFADYMIGELMRQLKTMGLFDKTLVVVSSDHGEDMGEHDFYFSHGNTLYEPAIRIPLILCLGPELPKKTAVPVQVSSLDIVPTILDIIGIAQPRTMAGKSLMPLCKGKNTRMREEAFSYTGRDFTSGGVRRSQPRKYSVRTERWKLIDKIRGTELYDLKNDPEERKNVIGEHAPEFEVLRKKLLRWKKICEPSPAAVRRAVMTQDSHERLKGLGYLQ